MCYRPKRGAHRAPKNSPPNLMVTAGFCMPRRGRQRANLALMELLREGGLGATNSPGRSDSSPLQRTTCAPAEQSRLGIEMLEIGRLPVAVRIGDEWVEVGAAVITLGQSMITLDVEPEGDAPDVESFSIFQANGR